MWHKYILGIFFPFSALLGNHHYSNNSLSINNPYSIITKDSIHISKDSLVISSFNKEQKLNIALKSSNKNMGVKGCAIIHNLNKIVRQENIIFSICDPFNPLNFAECINGKWFPIQTEAVKDSYVLNKVSIPNSYEPLIYSIELNGKIGTWMDEYPGYYKGIKGVYSKEHWKAGLIGLVKYYYNKYKMIPLFQWHLENPYVPTGWWDEQYGRILAARYRYTHPSYPIEHKYVINEILNNTGDTCGTGRYSGTKSDGYINPRAWFINVMKELNTFINALTDSTGSPIPCIFRPLHEMSDNWQWWGTNSVSATDFKLFFRLMIDILHTSNNQNVLVVYNPDKNALSSEEKFFTWYPGDDYVDIIACDYYNISNYNKFEREIKDMCSWANKRGKLAAILEINANKKSKWYTKNLSRIIKNTNLSIIAMYTEYYVFGNQTLKNFQKDSTLLLDLKDFLREDNVIKRCNRIDLTK